MNHKKQPRCKSSVRFRSGSLFALSLFVVISCLRSCSAKMNGRSRFVAVMNDKGINRTLGDTKHSFLMENRAVEKGMKGDHKHSHTFSKSKYTTNS
jgi:hypothetical protein